MTAPERNAGIRTRYRGVMMRSILETRWACFFDLVGIAWNYEPLELDGYLPDFLLDAKVFSRPQVPGPVLVEVRPLTQEADYREVINKIARAGWKGSAIVCGAAVWTRATPYGRESILGKAYPAVSPDQAEATSCAWYPVGYFRREKLFGMGGDDLESVWREATRRTQWSPPR